MNIQADLIFLTLSTTGWPQDYNNRDSFDGDYSRYRRVDKLIDDGQYKGGR